MKIGKQEFKWTALAVIAFLLFFFFAISKEAKAETHIEIAPAVAYGGDFAKQFAVIAHERFAEKYDIGVVLLIDLEDENGNRAIEFVRTVNYKKWEIGLGYAFWANESPGWNTDNTFTLVLGRQFGDNWNIRLRHWSTGGTSSLNSGMDMLTIGYGFGD